MPSGASSPWEPLPLIIYGYAIHSLSPNSRRDTRMSTRTRVSSVSDRSADDRSAFRDVVALEVGDEVYAFEKYTPKGKEVEGVWYRGYVVCTALRPSVSWTTPSDASSSSIKTATKTEEPQQVFIGTFPASHIYVRDELPDFEGKLAALTSGRNQDPNGSITNGAPTPWVKEKAMYTLREEDEELNLTRKSFRLVSSPDRAHSSRSGLAVYPASIKSRSSSPAPSEVQAPKPAPPQPSLKSGDDTASGAVQPIVDEIASALREWHGLMFQYLAQRDYKLFHNVHEHIEALHVGRRQLLAHTLSVEETTNLRRACVARLVSGNIVQGLDVIVRHPTWGGLVTVDVGGEIDTRSWVSAIRMYALQVSLAYLDGAPRPALTGSKSTLEQPLVGPLPTPANSSFPELLVPRGGTLGIGSPLHKPQHRHTSSGVPVHSQAAKFYHVFLDVRAFVASFCAPGESAELFFSLYNKADSIFVTEEFCAVLNHNGVLARDPNEKIRTLFTDLVQSDVQDPIYLVCRIVRNGAMKIGTDMGTGAPDLDRRGSQSSVRDPMSRDGGYLNGGTRASFSVDGSAHFRRPFGCAVLELTQLGGMLAEQSEMSSTKEYTMPIFVPTNESMFSMTHQDVIANNVKEFEKSPRAEMLAVSIKIFHGEAKTVVRENTSLLQDTPLTHRLSFPDVVFPGDIRNEVYIKLWSADFSFVGSGGSRLSVANFARGPIGPPSNNVQVTIEVRDMQGRTIDHVISMGSGEPPVAQFNSMVFQRNHQPTYGELLKLQLPMEGVPDWHLFFTFRNRGGREGRQSGRAGDATDKPFGFAFLPLFPQNRTFLEDGGHTLVVYKADKVAQITPDLYLYATSSLSAGQRPDQIQVPADMQRVAPPLRDTVTLRSSLISTRFTQNAVLLTLLRWQQVQDKELLSTVLTTFTFVGEVEIVKFLRDIFDSLFGIMTAELNQRGDMDLLVFNALVTVLGIVQDRRFRNFQPVLDVYIDEHFNYAGAASHMISSMNRLLADPAATETASSLRAALKVWYYVFKFIARSRELQKVKELELAVGGNATAEHLESKFRRELRSHLAEVNRMMAATSPAAIIGTQTIALQHFTSILPELAKIFNEVELVTIATTFATSVKATKGKIVIWKLIMYLQLVKGFLFDQQRSRSLLVEAVVVWIKPYFGRFDEYSAAQMEDGEGAADIARVSWLESCRLCVTIIAVMLDKLQQCLVDPTVTSDRARLREEQDNVEYLLSLLPRLLSSYAEFQSPASWSAIERTHSPATVTATIPVTFPASYPFSLVAALPSVPQKGKGPAITLFNPGLGETAVVFLVLIASASPKHVLTFLESNLDIEGRDNFTRFLLQVFQVSSSILENDAFPNNWLNVNVMAHMVLVKLWDPIASIMESKFIPHQKSSFAFDATIWKDGLCMLLRLLSSEQLVIEEFSPQKRRAVWRLAGDIRGEGAAVLLRLWDALGLPADVAADSGAVTRFGGFQVTLNVLVSQVVNLCLSHHDQLRSNAVHILYSMIVSEYYISEQFLEIENEVVNRLDTLFMSDSKTDEISKTFFVSQLRQLFESSQVDEALRDQVTSFLDSVDDFLDLLLGLRALPEGEEFADDRVMATLRLMNFVRRKGREEMYIKYVHQLVNMHLQLQNYVEAGLTLRLHSDLYEWNLHSFVPPMEDLGLPQQSQFHRKETLCLLILDYLGKGKAWESAIEICKELIYQHQEVTFNYGRLAEILRHQAALLEQITTEQRYYPEYFRVTYYGNFPTAVRSKPLIFRGYEWEKFGAFCERMLNKHPGAQLLKFSGDPPPDIRFGRDQYIQCTIVVPEPDRDSPVFTQPDVPPQIRSYYEHNEIKMFSSSRTITKIARNGEEEAWVEKTIFYTEASFPTVLRRADVEKVIAQEISPTEHALDEVEQKTRELSSLYVRYSAVAQTAQVVSTNTLSMTLNGAVDAPAGGGVSSFRQAFLTPDYLARHPDRADEIDRLRQAMEEHVRTVQLCLRLHGQMCPPEMLPFHETLERFFRKTFAEEIQQMDGMSDIGYSSSIAPSSRSNQDLQTSQYHNSASSALSISSASTSRAPFVIPPLELGGPTMATPIMAPSLPSLLSSQRESANMDGGPTTPRPAQTPLKRHLAQLARHGMNAVSSGSERAPSTDTRSMNSPSESIINVGGPTSSAAPSITKVNASTASLKGRFSKLGFGRRDG